MGDAVDRRQWHLEKSISVGHIVSTIMLMIAAITAFTQIKTDVEAVKTRVNSLESSIERRDNDFQIMRAELRADIQVLRSEVRQDLQVIMQELRAKP